MPATPVCFGRVKSKVARLTRLDACGGVVTALGSVVSSGFIKADAKMNMDTGTDWSTKNAWGDYCITQRDNDTLKSIGLQIDFCQVDPDLPELLTGARSVVQVAGQPSTAGTTIGWAKSGTVNNNGFALELWTKITGGACSVGGAITWFYTVYPWIINGQMGDESYGNGVMDFSFTGDTNGAPSTWTTGPYAVKPHPDLTVAAGEHVAHVLTTVQPPTAGCGLVAVT